MKKIAESLKKIVGKDQLFIGDEISSDYTHDESISVTPGKPDILVKPGNKHEISRILALADEKKIPITPRASGTGLSGGAIPVSGGIMLSFERMNRILEIDEENFVAVVEPGVVLSDLYRAVEDKGFYYPIYPGEVSASIGGNVSTNAGGMSAVKYGVTRNYVLGLEFVLPGGKIIETGGKYVKVSTGYDLTQLIVGSEGTLGIITKIILRLMPSPMCTTTLLVPFENLSNSIKTVPKLFKSGVCPVTIEFIEKLSLMAMEEYTGKKVSMNDEVRNKAEAFLIIVIEGGDDEEALKYSDKIGKVCMENGAIDIIVPPTKQTQHGLLALREKAYFAAKAAGATELLDIVVPRGLIPGFIEGINKLAMENSTIIGSAGHAGDGNVHLALFEGDEKKRSYLMKEIYKIGFNLGGTISAEHGIGIEKRKYFLEMIDKDKIELMRGIKKVFDPNNIMNPGKIF